MDKPDSLLTLANLSKWLLVLAVSLPVAIYFSAWVEHGKTELLGAERDVYLSGTENLDYVPEKIYVETANYRFNPLWLIAVFVMVAAGTNWLLEFLMRQFQTKSALSDKTAPSARRSR